MKGLIEGFVVVGILAVAIEAFAENGSAPAPADVDVATAELDGKLITPESCSGPTRACAGLSRGATLDVKLTDRGYAVAFLQDGYGNFFNQEGRGFIKESVRGDTKLWPGTDSGSEDRVIKLYVVSSGRPITVSPDDRALEALPEGQQWGPVFLSVGSPNRPASVTGSRPKPIEQGTSGLTGAVVALMSALITGAAAVLAALVTRSARARSGRRGGAPSSRPTSGRNASGSTGPINGGTEASSPGVQGEPPTSSS